MRAGWAVLAGLVLGGGAAWWLAREPAAQTQAKARRAAAAQARDAAPALYRWRDDAGVLQITDHPPEGRRYERIARDVPRGIRVEGDNAGSPSGGMAK